MNFIIVNSIVGIILMFSGTFESFKSPSAIRNLTYVGAFLSLFICLNSFLGLVNIPQMGIADVKFTGQGWLFLSCMEVCFIFYLVLNFSGIVNLGRPINEQMALLFFIFTGGALLVAATNLLIFFLGIEIISIPLYILTGIDKKNLKGNEAALKYVLLGALATCILLMGICLLYGATGSFNIGVISNFTAKGDMLFIVGLLFVMIALAFKVSAAPFHYWTPDIYEGAPIQYTSFMATIVKSFFLIGFLTLFANNNASILHTSLKYQVLIIIACTFIIGNFTAVFQQGLKRLMAYSSISQVGFMLIAVFNPKFGGQQAIFLYTVLYSVASIGIFAILSKSEDQSIENFKGLYKQQPVLALVLTIFLLSLAGIPLTAGFLAKFSMIQIAVKSSMSLIVLCIIIICSTVSLFYYLRIIQNIYFKEHPSDRGLVLTQPISTLFQVLLLLAAALIIILGIQPGLLLNLINY